MRRSSYLEMSGNIPYIEAIGGMDDASATHPLYAP